ncbi:MAG: acetate--CoA ligase family protein [Bifidobacteriaceae bacterium]|jgi:acyl-CoA synthetase (NDP forming)|nr:acetate--CoA ligase family protein [Bifidobacteriaceae bacterium]
MTMTTTLPGPATDSPTDSPTAPGFIDALFNPRSVGIIGASSDTAKYGNWLAVQALRMPPDRGLHLVNRKGEEILGQRSVKTLSEAPGTVELVAIAVPAAGFEAAVADALDAGARAIIGVTAGFAELGREGRAIQDRVVRRVRAAGARLIGPNCLGVVDSTSKLFLASNELAGGSVALLSQSGNMALELSGFMAERGLGFSRFVSLGNQADVRAAELIEACAAHEATKVIALYLEDFGDGREFVEACAGAVRAGKPVLLATVGGSEASARGAASHTGAMTSGRAVVDAACREAGIIQVSTPRQMADALWLLSAFGGSANAERVGVIADGGGHAGVACDSVERAGGRVAEFSDAVSAELRGLLPPSACVTNPVDIAGAGEADIYSFARVLETVLASPDTDAVAMTGYFGGYGEYGPELARDELDCARQLARMVSAQDKPVAVQTMYHRSPAADVLRQGGVPVFAAIEDACVALAHLRGPRARHDRPAQPEAAAPVASNGYWDARAMLMDAGLAFPAARLVSTRAEALAAGEAIGYPVVLKAMGLLHKTDSGGVALGVDSREALAAAFDRMHAKLAAPAYTVEAMAELRDAVELIVGVQRDPRFGPVAMVGIGGILAEVQKDVAFALAPLTSHDAAVLLRSLRSAPVLGGLRGKPGVDLAAAANGIVQITNAACAHPELVSLEVNPLAVTPGGAIALDARTC